MTSEELKRWREKAGFTQAELSEALQVTEMTVYRWETGKAPISRAVELALKQIECEKDSGPAQ